MVTSPATGISHDLYSIPYIRYECSCALTCAQVRSLLLMPQVRAGTSSSSDWTEDGRLSFTTLGQITIVCYSYLRYFKFINHIRILFQRRIDPPKMKLVISWSLKDVRRSEMNEQRDIKLFSLCTLFIFKLFVLQGKYYFNFEPCFIFFQLTGDLSKISWNTIFIYPYYSKIVVIMF